MCAAALYRFDSVYELFTRLPPMPVPLTRFAYASGSECIYLVGGIGGDVGLGTCWDFPPRCNATNTSMATVGDTVAANPGRTGYWTYAYNITAGAWRNDVGLARAKLNVPRSDACAAYINGLLYVVGGYSEMYNISDALEVMDPRASPPVWRQLARLPSPRGDLSCVALNGLLYVFGGYYDPFCATVGCFNTDAFNGGDARAGGASFANMSNFRTDTWSYDPATDAWTARAPMRYARADAAFAALPGGRLVAAGGEHNLRTTAVKVPQHSVEMYFAAEDTWAEKAPMPNARFRFAAAAVEQTTYAFGGQSICVDDGTGEGGIMACQSTASGTYSAFFELDHPDVFVQLPLSAGPGLTYDAALDTAAFVANETRRRASARRAAA